MNKLLISFLTLIYTTAIPAQNNKSSFKQDVLIGCLKEPIDEGKLLKTKSKNYYVVKKGIDERLDKCIKKIKIEKYNNSFKLYIEGNDNFLICDKVGQIYENEIDGDFEGWEGDTVFKMVDGQVWQQIKHDYAYFYAYHPKVLIYKHRTSWYLKVEGISKTIEIKRIN